MTDHPVPADPPLTAKSWWEDAHGEVVLLSDALDALAAARAPDADLECLECGGRIGPRRAPDAGLRAALDRLVLSGALDDVHAGCVRKVADALASSPAPDAGLRADPNDLLALCDAADKDGRHTLQTSTIRAWVRAALASPPAPDLVLVRRDSGGVFPDGTTNHPAIDFDAEPLASSPAPAGLDVLDRLERFSHRAEVNGKVDADQLRKAITELRAATRPAEDAGA